MIVRLALPLSLVLTIGCGGPPEPLEPTPPTVSAAAPSTPDDPTLFAPGVVSTRQYELNAALTPDGDTLFFTASSPNRSFRDYTLMTSTRTAEGWTAPTVAPFSGVHSDADPLVNQDGSRVYFISDRPHAGKPAGRDFDLWYVERTSEGFGEAVNLGAPINTDSDEFYVSVTTTGTIYFSAARAGGPGGSDIFRSEFRDGVYQEPTALPEPVNSPGPEFDPFVAPDESYVIFTSFRPDSLGSADLYISYRNEDTWGPAKNLGPTINSSAFEFCPIVSPDGEFFFYTSEKRREPTPADRVAGVRRFDRIDNGLGNVYRVPISSLPHP